MKFYARYRDKKKINTESLGLRVSMVQIGGK